MAIPRIAAVKPSGVLAGLLHDVDRLFLPPRPLPDADARARRVVDAIDWTRPTIVIWVPGTNEQGVAPEVAELLGRRRGISVGTVDYQATWRMAESVADGEAALRAVLELVRQRVRPGQRVVLLGRSQGAWVISSVLRDPALARLVDRASLVAHPGMAPAHAHDARAGTHRLGAAVREFNGSGDDVVTRDLGRSTDAAVRVVDSFARIDIGRALAGVVGIAVRDPAVLQALVASQLFRLRGERNPHDSSAVLRDAVDWLFAASAAAS